MKAFRIQHLFHLLFVVAAIDLPTNAIAAAYQLWEQDGASIGNYHAGRAAIAEDASTAYYNPAGLVRLHNQQLVIGIVPILTDFRYHGTVNVNTLATGPQPATAQGGGFNIVPDFHYSSPISANLVFGLSIVAPFGLKTNYGNASAIRYTATLTSLRIVDFSPSLGFALSDKLSLGLGIDGEHLDGEFNLVGTFLSPIEDSQVHNNGSSNGFGYHLGALYQFSPHTRVGIGYHSKVGHCIKGSSKFIGPLANNAIGGVQYSNALRLDTTLPATTSLSLFHVLNPSWDFMGSIIYTQWNVVQNFMLENAAGVAGNVASNSIVVDIPNHFRNTWNYSIGANYHVNKQWMLRTGLGFDETPTNNRDRNPQLPDGDRIAVAIGGHYQATKSLALDLGWTHLFAVNTRISNCSQTFGDQVTTTNGTVRAEADVYGLQMKWDFA